MLDFLCAYLLNWAHFEIFSDDLIALYSTRTDMLYGTVGYHCIRDLRGANCKNEFRVVYSSSALWIFEWDEEVVSKTKFEFGFVYLLKLLTIFSYSNVTRFPFVVTFHLRLGENRAISIPYLFMMWWIVRTEPKHPIKGTLSTWRRRRSLIPPTPGTIIPLRIELY